MDKVAMFKEQIYKEAGVHNLIDKAINYLEARQEEDYKDYIPNDEADALVNSLKEKYPRLKNVDYHIKHYDGHPADYWRSRGGVYENAGNLPPSRYITSAPGLEFARSTLSDQERKEHSIDENDITGDTILSDAKHSIIIHESGHALDPWPNNKHYIPAMAAGKYFGNMAGGLSIPAALLLRNKAKRMKALKALGLTALAGNVIYHAADFRNEAVANKFVKDYYKSTGNKERLDRFKKDEPMEWITRMRAIGSIGKAVALPTMAYMIDKKFRR